MQTEKAKSSHFDRARGDKNQIFPTKGYPCIKKLQRDNLFHAYNRPIEMIQCKFSCIDRTRGDKNQIIRTFFSGCHPKKNQLEV